jgi:hypothetical protein
MEGKVASRRAVWQKQGGDEEMFLYCSSSKHWMSSSRKNMEAGSFAGFMVLFSTALTRMLMYRAQRAPGIPPRP